MTLRYQRFTRDEIEAEAVRQERLGKHSQRYELSAAMLRQCLAVTDVMKEEIDRLRYAALPTRAKPKCKGKVYLRSGKFLPCNRTAEHNSTYCFSHRNYEGEHA
jgi:hypothetical protein